MRRAARPLLYVGVLVVVLGLAQIHARYIGHDPFTGTFRFGWTLAYATVLSAIAYVFGLPDEDIRKLLTVLSRLVDQGNTVPVIEHNLDVIKTADWRSTSAPRAAVGEAPSSARAHRRWWPRSPAAGPGSS